MMRFTVFTLFPDFFLSPLSQSLVAKGIAAGHLEAKIVDIRAHAEGTHKQCDDTPYGGGAGMVMKPEPIAAAMQYHKVQEGGRRVYVTPRGTPLTQAKLEEWAHLPELQILCGRYEGVDQRVIEHYIDEEISLGDYVLNGGEVAALALIEGVARLLPGVLGSESSLAEESFSHGLLEYPHYTRPPEFEGLTVPEVLLGGNHAGIAAWRRKQAEELTRQRRPDLLRSETAPDKPAS